MKLLTLLVFFAPFTVFAASGWVNDCDLTQSENLNRFAYSDHFQSTAGTIIFENQPNDTSKILILFNSEKINVPIENLRTNHILNEVFLQQRRKSSVVKFRVYGACALLPASEDKTVPQPLLINLKHRKAILLDAKIPLNGDNELIPISWQDQDGYANPTIPGVFHDSRWKIAMPVGEAKDGDILEEVTPQGELKPISQNKKFAFLDLTVIGGHLLVTGITEDRPDFSNRCWPSSNFSLYEFTNQEFLQIAPRANRFLFTNDNFTIVRGYDLNKVDRNLSVTKLPLPTGHFGGWGGTEVTVTHDRKILVKTSTFSTSIHTGTHSGGSLIFTASIFDQTGKLLTSSGDDLLADISIQPNFIEFHRFEPPRKFQYTILYSDNSVHKYALPVAMRRPPFNWHYEAVKPPRIGPVTVLGPAENIKFELFSRDGKLYVDRFIAYPESEMTIEEAIEQNYSVGFKVKPVSRIKLYILQPGGWLTDGWLKAVRKELSVYAPIEEIKQFNKSEIAFDQERIDPTSNVIGFFMKNHLRLFRVIPDGPSYFMEECDLEDDEWQFKRACLSQIFRQI